MTMLPMSRVVLVSLFSMCPYESIASGQDIIASIDPNEATIRLSDHLRVSLAIDGPKPLRVQVPSRLLDDPSRLAWRLQSLGPGTLHDLPNGRQRWTRVYEATPLVPGKRLTLGFAPVAVTAGTAVEPEMITFPPVPVTVTTQVSRLDPEEIRPITPPLPAPESFPRYDYRRVWLTGFLTLFTIAVILLMTMRGRRSWDSDPRQRFLQELKTLRHVSIPINVYLDTLFHGFHHYLESRYSIPATRRTASELEETPELLSLPSPLRDRIIGCLRQEDPLRFSGESITRERLETLRIEMERIVETISSTENRR